MAIKVYGDKIVFPDSTEQKTAYSDSEINNSYTKEQVDAQQKEQDDKIQANTDAIEVNADEISDKLSEAPVDGKPYARKNKGWHEVEGGTGDVEEAPKDGKTYGRKDEAWAEVTTNSYTKAEINAQQEAQDDAIADNKADIAQNTADIVLNKADIEKNKTDIESLVDDVDALTGSVIYKGSLNATVTPAPAEAVVGDMYINEYNVDDPATNYPVASGWTPVVEVKYDDKLIKTDSGWDKIESVVGVPSYTAGEIDALLDDKADKDDSYLKAEADALLNDKADSDLVYTKVESDTKNSEQDTAIQANTDAIASIPTAVDTYTKDEIDAQQIVQDDAIQANAEAITNVPTDVYTKDESDATNDAQDVLIQANADAIDALPDPIDAYTKDEVDASQAAQDTEIAKKANTGDSYTKSEANTLLDNKANVGDSYTKAEVDESQDLQNTEIDTKADVGDSYTKAEEDVLLNEKANKDEVDTELAKKADKATTYTKNEIDELLESASGAIIGNYTNKWTDSVARDPEAGNLYLVYGMNFSSKYDEVTKIYISDTDGDGEVRDFDEVKENDKIKLSSENGSGEYTIVGISDVGGYRELILNTESSDGTIANDSAVSIVLDVASSGESGGIEEAPSDGKQYARQDEAWTEVEASGTGGGGEAQPPVAFSFNISSSQSTPTSTPKKVNWNVATIDTENALKDGNYVVKKAGLYNFAFNLYLNVNKINDLKSAKADIKKNGEQSKIYSYLSNTDNAQDRYSPTASGVLECEVGDIISVEFSGVSKSGNQSVTADYRFSSFSGHMISSITEGEVKEKEAVVMKAGLSSAVPTLSNNSIPVPYDTVEFGNSSDMVDGKFKPSVSGYYNIMASATCTTTSQSRAFLSMFKNGGADAIYKTMDVDGTRIRNTNVSGIVYFNGTTDYVDFTYWTTTASTLDIKNTIFNAHLITGQSSGGGSGTGTTTATVDTAIGMVAPFAMDSVPTGWLHCDGSEVSRDTYSLLYSKVGDTYGAGDGTTTFNLPDLQDEFIRGSSDTLPVGNKQDDEFKEHDHINTAGGASGGGSYGSLAGKTTSGKTGLTGGEETRPRNVAMLYCINATAEPSSGGGETTDILPVLYSGTVNADGTVRSGTGFTSSKSGDGEYNITFDTPLDNSNYSVSVSGITGAMRTGTILTNVNTGFTANINDTNVGRIDSNFTFAVISQETIAVGGGSGGSYTPEKMVWENVSSEREFDTVYTNTKDVPMYVQTYINYTEASKCYAVFKIDGKEMGYTGMGSKGTSSGNNPLHTTLHIVPSGSTYEVSVTSSVSPLDLQMWEARMPVAVGTGGGTPTTWVNFDGTTAEPTIKGSNNVSSVVKNSTGNYTINFSTPLDNANYAPVMSVAGSTITNNVNSCVVAANTLGVPALKTESQLQITVGAAYANNSLMDLEEINVVIVGDGSGSASGDSAKVKALEARLDELEKRVK